MKNYVLFNPLAGNGRGEKSVNSVEIQKDEAVFLDMTEITDYKAFCETLLPQDKIIVCGGDGTLNRFINAIDGIELKNEIFYIGAGSGNDFLNDLNLKPTNKPLKINQYIKDLPKLEVKGKTYRFINGIGFGLDGYCCAERERKMQNNKSANYTLIALKALLFGFKPQKATVVADGKEYNYDRVWMVSTMLGRFFGGGMMIAPIQDRDNSQGTLTVIVAHNMGKFKIVSLFLSIFGGKHLKYKKYVAVHTGHIINVKYEYPVPLQIDGEAISGVLEYTVDAEKRMEIKK